MDPCLSQLQREIASAVSGLSSEELMRSVPGKWCTAEILEHLYLTYTGTVKGFGRVQAADKPLATKTSWKQRGRALVVVGLGYMPRGRKSPEVGLPRGMAAEKVTANIGTALTEMDEIMAKCAAKFGSRIKLSDHPILGPLSIYQWRKFHLVHGLHHVKQIRGLRNRVQSGDL